MEKKIILLKVGGAVVSDCLPELTKAVQYLLHRKHFPVIIHGGGPQLNKALEGSGIAAKYHKGMRITDAATLEIAARIFSQENAKITEHFKNSGILSKGFTRNIFIADYLNFDIWQHVGKVQKVNSKPIFEAINNFQVPVISCLASHHQDPNLFLNINADTASCQAAKFLKPVELVFTNTTGGLVIEGSPISSIDVYSDSLHFLSKSSVKHGTRLKIVEISNLLYEETNCRKVILLKTDQLLQYFESSISQPSQIAKNPPGSTVFYRNEQNRKSFQEENKQATFFASKTIGIIGARGYVGAELIALILKHPNFELGCVSSRNLEGNPIKSALHLSGKSSGENIDKNAAINMTCVDEDLVDAKISDMPFVNIQPTDIIAKYKHIDCWVLALPNNLSTPFVEMIPASSVCIDLSADHRFDPAWQYGFPERFRSDIIRAKRIANPGCYATAAQTSLLPLMDPQQKFPALLGVHIFGVSGYSGAGTNPSPKNDPIVLCNNLIPYSLVGHIHEREISTQVGLSDQIHFIPHVASHFRGISLTISVTFAGDSLFLSTESVFQTFHDFFKHEPLIKVIPEIPLVKDNSNEHFVCIGGFSVDHQKNRLVMVATIDNLLKGAATQALQNMNLSLGIPNEFTGILD